MCLIVTQSRADNPIDLTRDEIFDAFEQNSDGAGLMFDFNGKLIVKKPLNTAHELYEAYQEALGEYTTHLGVHWRWATSGSNNDTNTHPHVLCRGKVGLMHNGVLSSGSTDFDISDTVFWARTVFYGRSQAHIMGRRFRDHIQQYIDGDKIALMDKDGNLSLLNENEGTWSQGRWHSNDCLWNCYTQGFFTRAWTEPNKEIGARFVWPFSSCGTKEFLSLHFDEEGCLVDTCGSCIPNEAGRPRMASDLVDMENHHDDDDIHEYFGLLTNLEIRTIESITEEWEDVFNASYR